VPRRVLNAVVDFYWGQGLAYQAPALAFYLVVSLVPLALGLTALAGLLFGDLLAPERVTSELADQFPVQIRDQIADLAGSVKNNSPQLLVISILAMIWTSSAAIGVIERTMTPIIGGPPFTIVWGRVRLLIMGGGFGLLVCAAIAFATLTAGWIPLPAWAVVALNTSGLLGLCTLIFHFAPSKRPRLRSALVGALPATTTLQLTPLLVGIYFSFGARFSPGGIFFSLAVILASCFVIAQGMLIGAALAARRG
jgi:uncharacterized BrkB/YihY/UPF0761 family membrane protein